MDQNKRGPKQGTSSFVELTIEELLDLLANSPSKKVPVRRKWVEQCAAANFLGAKNIAAAKVEEPVSQTTPEDNSIFVEELDLDEKEDPNNTENTENW